MIGRRASLLCSSTAVHRMSHGPGHCMRKMLQTALIHAATMITFVLSSVSHHLSTCDIHMCAGPLSKRQAAEKVMVALEQAEHRPVTLSTAIVRTPTVPDWMLKFNSANLKSFAQLLPTTTQVVACQT